MKTIKEIVKLCNKSYFTSVQISMSCDIQFYVELGPHAQAIAI